MKLKCFNSDEYTVAYSYNWILNTNENEESTTIHNVVKYTKQAEQNKKDLKEYTWLYLFKVQN